MQNHNSKFKMATDSCKRVTVILVLVVSAAGVSFARYSGGSGEPNDPYRIATPNDLNDIGNHVEDFNKCFIMVNDINLADYNGTQFNIIGTSSSRFTGVFDGNGHAISNFTYSSTGTNYIGLFGYVSGATAEIKDLGLIGPNVDAGAGDYVGSLVGRLDGGIVTNCYIEGCCVSAHWYTGGMLGSSEGTISHCWVSGRVSGGEYHIGGLLGYNWEGTISNCSASAVVEANSPNSDFNAGGLVGEAHKGMISHCFATGDVYGEYYAGGLVGRNSGPILKSYATGTARGLNPSGGLVGYAASSSAISDCYARGDVIGYSFAFSMGGLVGYNESHATICNCYATGKVTGLTNAGGLVGWNRGGTVSDSFWDVNTSGLDVSDGGEGKTTAEMQAESTFTDAGWDFVEVWDIGEKQTYPFLRVHPAGDVNHDDRVDWLDLAILAGHWLEGAE